MNKIGKYSAILVLLVGIAQSTPAFAIGAVALGVPENVAKQGLAVGYAYNFENEGDAKAKALGECINFKDAPAETRVLCKVVRTFSHECISIAMDPKPSTPGWGYSISNTKATADDQAMQECRNTAGSDRIQFCVVAASECDK